jgi:enoyl-CoA hydratase
MAGDPALRAAVFEEARALVHNLVACATPVVAAVRGPAVGAGLAVALMSDICVVTPDARLVDGHVRIGVAAGDHAALVWPLACGMAKAKRHLLLPDPVSGADAERMGLVAECVPDAELDATAETLARRLAAGSQGAMRATKRALHGWYQQALPTFDASLAQEFLNFGQADAQEGLAAMRDRRDPGFS